MLPTLTASGQEKPLPAMPKGCFILRKQTFGLRRASDGDAPKTVGRNLVAAPCHDGRRAQSFKKFMFNVCAMHVYIACLTGRSTWLGRTKADTQNSIRLNAGPPRLSVALLNFGEL